MLGLFRNWKLSRRIPVIDQQYLQPTTVNDSSQSSTTTSTENHDPNTPLQPATTQRPDLSPFSRVYQVWRQGVAGYGKPGLKRDLASWTGIMILGTSFMMYAPNLNNPISRDSILTNPARFSTCSFSFGNHIRITHPQRTISFPNDQFSKMENQSMD